MFLTLSVFLIFKTDKKVKRINGLLFFLLSLIYIIWGDINNCFGVLATGQLLGIILFILAAFLLSPKVNEIRYRPLFIIIGGVTIVIIVILSELNYTLSVLEYPLLLPFGGVGLLILCIGVPIKKIPAWVFNICTTSFGVYLCHIIFLEGFEFLTEKKVFNEIYYGLGLKLAITGLIFILSVIFILLMRKFMIIRFLFLGER